MRRQIGILWLEILKLEDAEKMLVMGGVKFKVGDVVPALELVSRGCVN